MNILLIAFGFPPSRASGVYRAVAMAHHLTELGHAVTVIAGGADYFELATGTDSTLEETLPAGLRIGCGCRVAPAIAPEKWPKHQILDGEDLA